MPTTITLPLSYVFESPPESMQLNALKLMLWNSGSRRSMPQTFVFATEVLSANKLYLLCDVESSDYYADGSIKRFDERFHREPE